MTQKALFIGAVTLTIATSCSGNRETTASIPEPTRLQITVGTADSTGTANESPQANATAPKATAYRMSGDYADNVPITLGPDGSIISYPAPTDLTDRSTPIPLADGWWLDRRGITANSVFTRYTYSQYRALAAPPAPDRLRAAIIPGARVTVVQTLPMSLSQALADTAAVNAALTRLAPRFVPTPVP